MTREEQKQFIEKFFEDQRELLHTKGAAYIEGEDALGNFFTIAKEAGIDPMQVLTTYMSKQYNAIKSVIKHSKDGGEPIRQRFIDLANFCILGAALHEEILDLPKSIIVKKSSYITTELNDDLSSGVCLQHIGFLPGAKCNRCGVTPIIDDESEHTRI